MAAIIPCHYCSSMAISKLPRSHIPLGNINHVNAAWWGRQLSLRCSLKASQKAQLRNKLVFAVFVLNMVLILKSWKCMMPLNYCGLMKSSFYVLNRVFGDLFALQMFFFFNITIEAYESSGRRGENFPKERIAYLLTWKPIDLTNFSWWKQTMPYNDKSLFYLLCRKWSYFPWRSVQSLLLWQLDC